MKSQKRSGITKHDNQYYSSTLPDIWYPYIFTQQMSMLIGYSLPLSFVFYTITYEWDIFAFLRNWYYTKLQTFGFISSVFNKCNFWPYFHSHHCSCFSNCYFMPQSETCCSRDTGHITTDCHLLHMSANHFIHKAMLSRLVLYKVYISCKWPKNLLKKVHFYGISKYIKVKPSMPKFIIFLISKYISNNNEQINQLALKKITTTNFRPATTN